MKTLFPTDIQLQHYKDTLQLFQVFTNEEWAKYCSYLTCRILKNKEVLVEVGKVCQDIFFLDEGAIRYFRFKDGAVLTNYFSFKGELIAAYRSFVTGQKCTIGLESIGNTKVLVLSKKDFDLLCADEAFAFKMEQMRRRVAEYLALCYEERLHSFLNESPEERYLELMHDNAEVFLKIPQHYIANYLGITSVSLSRIRNRY